MQPTELIVDGYEPRFDRLGTTRRVLGFITDEVEIGVGPRNTFEALSTELAADPNTDYSGDPEQLRDRLDALTQAGLVRVREDGTFEVTDAGLVELVN